MLDALSPLPGASFPAAPGSAPDVDAEAASEQPREVRSSISIVICDQFLAWWELQPPMLLTQAGQLLSALVCTKKDLLFR